MTKQERQDKIKSALNPNELWSEDPSFILSELAGSAQAVLDRLTDENPGAISSQAFWQFVVTETSALSKRIKRAQA